MTDALALRDNAKHELMMIKTIETGVNYLNKMSAIEKWVKAEKMDAELQNIVAEQKLRTQRILGRLIKEGQKKGEIAKQSENQSNLMSDGNKVKKNLSDIGITPKQSHNFQQIFSIPEETFEEAIAKNKQAVDDAVMELTTSAFLRLAKHGTTDGKKPERMKCNFFNKDRLIELRKKAGISGYDLAMDTGIESSTISRLETGELRNPTFDTVVLIAQRFKVVMDTFINGVRI